MNPGFAAFTSHQIADFAARRQPSPRNGGGRTRFSVVMPCYNQQAYVARTLNSIANQHYAPLELIVMDGGSTDGSVAEIERYRDLIAHLESGPDGGQVEAINKGFARATGEFLAWQNSDDLYLPGFLHAVDAALNDHPQADLVIANSYVIGPDDAIIWGTKYGPFSVRYLARVGWNMTSQSVFVSRGLADRVGPLPSYPVAFDYEWFLKVAREARYLLQMKRYGGAYRIHPESKLSVTSQARREDLEKKILSEMGYAVRWDRSLDRQWPVRRSLLKAERKMHELMLYPRQDALAPLSGLWARALRAAGHHLAGY